MSTTHDQGIPKKKIVMGKSYQKFTEIKKRRLVFDSRTESVKRNKTIDKEPGPSILYD